MASQGASEAAEPQAAISQFGDKYYALMIEQYKLYVESSNKISDRRGTAQTFLLTANTALVTVYGLSAGKDVRLQSADMLWQILIPAAGLIVTTAWILLLRSYRSINAAKFGVILSIEEKLPLQCFTEEWARRNQRPSQRRIDLSATEQMVPAAFAALYVGLMIAAFL